MTWGGLVAFWTGRRRPDGGPIPHAALDSFRAQLGLPTTGAIIMTGHQAEFWHAGILAKYLAADAAARALNRAGQPTSAAWLVADQDSNDPAVIGYPKRGLVRAAWKLRPELNAAAIDLPSAVQPPLRVPPPLASDPAALAAHLDPASDSVRDGLVAIARALHAHEDEPSAARQLAAALRDLLTPLIPAAATTPTIFATDLARTDLFRAVVARIAADPAACMRAYNAAVAAVPEANLRPLALVKGGRVELPLWDLRPGEPRRRVFSTDLAGAAAIPTIRLAPRALLMTAALRLAGCDLFIHGTGGGVYDRATDAWIRAWLGPATVLAPTAIVTATRTLALTTAPPPTPEAIAHAAWTAHHARHDPAALGDDAAASRKRDLVDAIAQAKRTGGDTATPFRELHTLLQGVATDHADRLGSLAAEAAALRTKRSAAAVAFDRTWPFPLHTEKTLRDLSTAVERPAT